jgi:uncharacterized protein involved in exopolysaccharide biosynthesis
MQSLSDFVKSNWVILVVVLIAVGFFWASRKKATPKADSFVFIDQNKEQLGETRRSGYDYLRGDFPVALGDNPQFISSNLLPKTDNMNSDNNMEFAPTPDLGGMNFVDTKYQIGISSQNSRNANLSIRTDPYIAKVDNGPFGQSTIEPDVRRPLDIGSSC